MLTVIRNKAEGSAQGLDVDTDREQLRKEAETLIQVTEEARRDLLLQAEEGLSQDKGIQVNFDAENETQEEQAPQESTVPRNQQLQKWEESGEDTARWLYRLVFQESQLVDSRTSASSAVVLADPAVKSRVVEGLLHAWTTLTDDEIKHKTNGTAEDPKPAAPGRGRRTSRSTGVTVLYRRSVSPAALELGKEKYVEQDLDGISSIGVFRKLSQEEIDAYKEATATLRGRHQDGSAAGKRKEPRRRKGDTTSERDDRNTDAASSPWSLFKGATETETMVKAMLEAARSHSKNYPGEWVGF